MKVFLVIGSILIPILMFYIQRNSPKLALLYHSIAVIAALVFGNIASLSIYQVIKDNTVLMTNIHAIFLNPFFLLSGAYLGVYVMYLLLNLLFEKEGGSR
ncbi:transposase [Ornithinibacillus halotolerans]|uniref:Uncharacterized protein n=1 Tax=Ornithinibacillus halotolerans TaxID=1274357 RepID=A0A916RW81_9BACI|nr:transposase [Ornithinibacillus halotolerans]GGA72128.1 hypothetical protein GCM10008025_14930 [Ornithinibacillus halotolerans]